MIMFLYLSERFLDIISLNAAFLKKEHLLIHIVKPRKKPQFQCLQKRLLTHVICKDNFIHICRNISEQISQGIFTGSRRMYKLISVKMQYPLHTSILIIHQAKGENVKKLAIL